MSAPHPSLATIVAALDPQARARLRARLDIARPALTPGQRRLWDGTGHIVCQAVHLRGPVDADRLADAITAFTRRHEALRTTFRVEAAGIVPVVHHDLPPRIERLRCTGRAEAEAAARRLAGEPFDLSAGPLLRAGLAAGADTDETWLLLAVPNLVFDAWSFELLLDWLAARPADPGLAPAFSAFAGQQRRWVDSAEGRAAAEHWARVVADPPPPLPADDPDAAATGVGRRVAFTLPAQAGAAVQAAARAEAATPFAGWLGLFGALLAECSGRPDVLLSTFTANRDRPGTADLVGYVLNVLPVRLRGPAEPDLGAWVRAARDATRAGLPHAAYPGELIPGPPPSVAFVFEHLAPQPRTIHGAVAEPSDVDRGTARYELTLSVQPGPDGAACWLEYDVARYTEATVRRLAERFAALAGRAVTA
ncbi:hypothetical protein Dvina_20370 [Dactylosporangium vinaceum]|uniref:Condensation domain-containing protein n=1 Tax=Dactylosporangium vinaceum TaxID=53362 RepID=A0ABV5MS87_9ACTN|nr:condensation domain-containing protein [Dactylosporangium vinaceum]UAC00202.1 hypothetical protein Dvina_20370 [Dactylosporangium vinaceum]